MKQGLVFLLVFLFSQSMYAQKGNIHGYVKEAANDDPMIGASVFIKGSSTGTVTDFNGEFTLNGIDIGEQTLEFSYLGFTTIEQVITVTSGTIELDIAMEYEAVSLLDKDIVVTAQASAQMAAINKQRSSNTIANVISVKRIQELPDANAAEVVARLPGVSLQREGGEGAKVVIRGLSPKYNKVTLEGVKMASTGSGDRSTDMSMISPFMLEGIEVFKAALPDKEADAHGGSINFVLKEAPKKFKLDAYVSGGASMIRPVPDYKTVLGVSNRFFNNKLGVFVQGDYENRNRTSHSLYSSYRAEEPLDIKTDVIANTIAIKDVRRKINRIGGALVLDYKIPNGTIKFSNFGSTIKKGYVNRAETYGLLYKTHNYQMDLAKTDLLVATNALSIKRTFGSFDVQLKGSRAFSKNETPEGISIRAQEDAAFDLEVNTKASLKEILRYAKNNLQTARLEKISSGKLFTQEKEYAVSADVEYKLTLSKALNFSVKVGGKYKKLTKEHDRTSTNIPISWGQHGAPYRAAIADAFEGVELSNNISYAHFYDPSYDNDAFFKGEYQLAGAFNEDAAVKLAQIARDGDLYLTHHPTDNMFDYSGHEEYTAGYLMTTFNYKKLVTLIPGFRYEENKTTYTANQGDALAFNEYVGYKFNPVTTERLNSFLLPMVHLKIQPKKWLTVRMAYTETLAHPDFSQIIPSRNIAMFDVSWNNPYLKPSKSQNIDLYISAYNNKLGLVSVGAFKKQITNLIFDTGRAFIKEPADFGLPSTQKGRKITRIINNKFPLDLWGIESEYKTRFWYLDNFLKGVVLNLNYTHIFSKVKYPITRTESTFSNEPPYIVQINVDTFYVDKFIDQPNDIFNATVGYDIGGFSARVSYLYRTEIFSRAAYWENLRASATKYSRWDVSFKQSFPKGIEVMLNFANIFSQPEKVVLKNSGYLVNQQYYGTTIDLGVRYRFQ